jgi:hypothetical protein
MKLYTARISQIDEMKHSRNGGEQAFLRVYFQVKDDEKSTGKQSLFLGKNRPCARFPKLSSLAGKNQKRECFDQFAIKNREYSGRGQFSKIIGE